MQTELHTATPGTATGTIRLARTLVVLAGVLLAIAALGPLGLGVIEHHYERTMLNQAVGLDAFGAAVVVPVALGTARLSRRRHPAAAFLAMGPGAFATYMSVQYVVGPEYLVVDGNAEQFFLLFAGLFVAGATVLVEAWSATSEPPADAAVDRRRSAALLATAAFVVGGMYLANDFLSAMGDFPRFVAERAAVSEYDDHPSAFWIVAFLDLAVVVPVTTAVGWALWHHRPWARRAFYGVVGWYALVPGSVAAMALTMVVRDDVAADGTKAAFFTVTAAAMAAVALRSYRPLFRSDGVGGVARPMSSGVPGRRNGVSTTLTAPAAVRSGPVTTTPTALDLSQLDGHRRELTAYCYRMLGSGFEADDAVQETTVRAWRAADGFEGRSSVRSWLYRIATNVCLDMLRGRERRARPMEIGPVRDPDERWLADVRPEHAWISPIADDRVLPAEADPADVAELRDSIRLAFVTALQRLPARQRAALILCEVLKWQATEAAELLDTTVASVNSALQRARATLAAIPETPAPLTIDEVDHDLLTRYVDAFERYDVETLVTLLHDDAVQSMPPYAMWLQGNRNIAAWFLGPGIGCKGSRLVSTVANGLPAFGQYRVDPEGGHAPWALQVLEISDGKIAGFHAFLDVDQLFPAFGLPAHLPA